MRYAKYLLLLYPLTCIVLFFWYIHHKKGINHGLDFYDNIYLLGLLAAVAAYLLEKTDNSFFMAALVMNVMVAIFFIAADRLNIMLDYDKWIWRGMPGPFEESKIRRVDTNPELDKLDSEYSLLLRDAMDGKITQEEFNRKTAILRAIRENLKNEKAGH